MSSLIVRLTLLLSLFLFHSNSWACQECRDYCATIGDGCMMTCRCNDGSPASSHSALGTLIDSTTNAANAKQEFNERIALVRARYFESQSGTKEHASIEKEFASLLQEKDLTLAMPFITAGLSEQAQVPTQLFNLFSGGELDNGIPAAAKQAFEKWVVGIRGSLGAQSNNDMLAITDRSDFERALNTNTDLYNEYRTQRDAAERSVFDAQKKHLKEVEIAKTNVAADGGAPLQDKKVRVLASYDYRTGRTSADLDKAIMEMHRQEPSVLECTYGPGLSSTGNPVYYEFVYWYKETPANLAEVLQADTNRFLENLGNQARTDCPPSNLSALAERKALMQTHPWYRSSAATSSKSTTTTPTSNTDKRTEQRLALEQERQKKNCAAHADRVERAKAKATTSIGASRAYAHLQQTYRERCSMQ
jgi:hypothetical protein